MRSLTVQAESLQSARGLYEALSGFDPELSGSDDEGYEVAVELGGFDRQVITVLDVIQHHVSERHVGSARVELGGRSYTMQAE